MKILLIDVDSTIPNLALMKISAYEKTPRMVALKRWCRPWIFFTIEWENYQKSVKKIHDKREGGELSHTIVKKGGELPGGVSLD